MDDYIPREAVLELLAEKQKAICPAGRYGRGYVYGRDRDEYDAVEADIDAIENIPAADVMPIRHAKWLKATVRGNTTIVCSDCGCDTGTMYQYHLCPNCGAFMDAEDDNG